MIVWILFFAFLLRLPFLTQSLWLDEAIEALALMGKKGSLLHYALADFQPPLYHFLLKPWTTLFGYSEIVLRFPSLLFSLLSIYFAFRLTSLLTNRRLAVYVALLLSTNPLHIYYSTEGRTYMLTTFLITASFYYFAKLLRHPSSSPFTYLLFSIASLWTSYLAWFAIGCQLLYLLFTRRFTLLKYPFLAFLTLIFWLPFVLQQLTIGFSTISLSPQWGRVVGGFQLIRLPRTWFKFIAGRISFLNKQFYLTVMLFLFSFHSFFLKKTFSRRYSLLWLWLLGPLFIAYFFSLFIPVYQYFRLLFVLPAYMILLAIGIAKTKHPHLALMTLLIFNLTFLIFYLLTPRFHKEDWRALTTYLNHQPSGLVALPSLAQDAPLHYYHLRHKLIELPRTTTFDHQPVYYINYAEDLFDVRRLGQHNLRRQGYQPVAEKSFPNLHLIIYNSSIPK